MFFVNVILDSELLGEDLGILNIIIKDKKRNSFVYINVFLIDKKDEEFSIKYNLVSVMCRFMFIVF